MRIVVVQAELELGLDDLKDLAHNFWGLAQVDPKTREEDVQEEWILSDNVLVGAEVAADDRFEVGNARDLLKAILTT